MLETHISAKIICDSVFQGHRLTTMEMVYPLFIHNELMTHRMFSRNAASSRAIPIKKMVERVLTDPAQPVTWRENCRGMSPQAELAQQTADCARSVWCQAAQDAAHWALKLEELKVHKEITNRVLAPFLWMTTLVSATEWDNFFHLRTDSKAQKEFQVLARLAADEYYSAEPAERQYGDNHLPFIKDDDAYGVYHGSNKHTIPHALKLVSAARCARVSYLNHDGTRNISLDIELAVRLMNAGHWSPFEHIAETGVPDVQYGNFTGWRQFRKTFDAENFTGFHWPGKAGWSDGDDGA